MMSEYQFLAIIKTTIFYVGNLARRRPLDRPHLHLRELRRPLVRNEVRVLQRSHHHRQRGVRRRVQVR